MTPAAFVEGIARLSRGLPGAAALHRDAIDWLREPWGTEARAVEVLTEGIRVIIHEANDADVEDTRIGGLVALCVEATAAGVITDPYHAEFFAGCHPARN